jgi:hypothetical protein
MNKRRLQLAALAVFAALLIAILLRDAVEQLIIQPAVHILWFLGQLYRFVPQSFLWFFLLLAMLLLTLVNIVAKFDWPAPKKKQEQAAPGPLAEFASQLERKDGGIYFKWQVARILGDIAMDLQFLHQPERRRKLDFDKLSASADVIRYLEAGIGTSFSDYPLEGGYLLDGWLILPGWLPLPERFRRLPPTPFDIDIEPVIGYLETQMENDDDFKR